MSRRASGLGACAFMPAMQTTRPTSGSSKDKGTRHSLPGAQLSCEHMPKDRSLACSAYRKRHAERVAPAAAAARLSTPEATQSSIRQRPEAVSAATWAG